MQKSVKQESANRENCEILLPCDFLHDGAGREILRDSQRVENGRDVA